MSQVSKGKVFTGMIEKQIGTKTISANRNCTHSFKIKKNLKQNRSFIGLRLFQITVGNAKSNVDRNNSQISMKSKSKTVQLTPIHKFNINLQLSYSLTCTWPFQKPADNPKL